MAPKRPKATSTEDELGELFQGLGEEASATTTTAAPAKKPAAKSKPTTLAAKAVGEEDIFAELENQLTSQVPSRPHTPRVKDPAKPSPGRRSDDKSVARNSTESAQSSLRAAAATPSSEQQQQQETEKPAAVEPPPAAPSSGGGWWGGLIATASSAAKLVTDTAMKEISQNEEAARWADQVRNNVGALRGFGDEIRNRALPTFTDILHTIAPPISSHERLLVHITHDLAGYPSLDPLVHAVFARVMSQVEGGDLLVFQRGQETSGRRYGSDGAAGWRDGPWWRQTDSPRDLGLVKGLTEGTKLCRASAEAHAAEYFAAHGGVEGARVRATEPLSDSNPVRTSDLFLSVQAVSYDAQTSLFAKTSAAEKEKETSAVHDQEEAEELVCFAVFIVDPIHEIEFWTVSQTLPARWLRWLDAPAPLTPATDEDMPGPLTSAPEEIREIIESGAVDPREWVAEWVEDLLNLAVGVVAQRYVARRMGVGDGGIGRGKKKMEDVVEDGGGEAARAGLI